MTSDLNMGIAEKILAIISESLFELPSDFTVDGNLFEQGLDSMGIMHLILVTEETFGVALATSDITKENFESAKGITAIIESRRSAS